MSAGSPIRHKIDKDLLQEYAAEKRPARCFDHQALGGLHRVGESVDRAVVARRVDDLGIAQVREIFPGADDASSDGDESDTGERDSGEGPAFRRSPGPTGSERDPSRFRVRGAATG